jgi:hypothetical protein
LEEEEVARTISSGRIVFGTAIFGQLMVSYNLPMPADNVLHRSRCIFFFSNQFEVAQAYLLQLPSARLYLLHCGSLPRCRIP